jgi:hypothetical protein
MSGRLCRLAGLGGRGGLIGLLRGWALIGGRLLLVLRRGTGGRRGGWSCSLSRPFRAVFGRRIGRFCCGCCSWMEMGLGKREVANFSSKREWGSRYHVEQDWVILYLLVILSIVYVGTYYVFENDGSEGLRTTG